MESSLKLYNSFITWRSIMKNLQMDNTDEIYVCDERYRTAAAVNVKEISSPVNYSQKCLKPMMTSAKLTKTNFSSSHKQINLFQSVVSINDLLRDQNGPLDLSTNKRTTENYLDNSKWCNTAGDLCLEAPLDLTMSNAEPDIILRDSYSARGNGTATALMSLRTQQLLHLTDANRSQRLQSGGIDVFINVVKSC